MGVRNQWARVGWLAAALGSQGLMSERAFAQTGPPPPVAPVAPPTPAEEAAQPETPAEPAPQAQPPSAEPAPAPAGTPAQPAPAQAAPPPGQAPGSPPQQGYYEPPPPPLSTEDDTVRTHDGTYFRASFGGGFGSVNSEGAGLNAEYKAGAWLLDLSVGGTAGNTFSVGGTLLLMELLSPDVEIKIDNQTLATGQADDNLGVVVLGPFVDFFFGPHSGGHLGALLGIASIGLQDENEDPSSGYGLGLFGGYDFWVADQWALGMNARYTYVHGERNFTDLDITIVDRAHLFGLSFTALNH